MVKCRQVSGITNADYKGTIVQLSGFSDLSCFKGFSLILEHHSFKGRARSPQYPLLKIDLEILATSLFLYCGTLESYQCQCQHGLKAQKNLLK